MSAVRLAEALLRLATGRPDVAEAITGDLIATGRPGPWIVFTALRVGLRYGMERTVRRRRSRGISFPPSRNGPAMSLLHDLRYALRGLRTAPAFTTIAVLTVALGVGANVAIYSLVHAIMLTPLPYPAPDDMVRVWPGESVTMGWLEAFQDTESFAAVAGVTGSRATMTGQGEPLELVGASVTASLFEVTGVRPAMGRPFTREDMRPEAEAVIIVSHRLWQSAFGGDSSVVGRTVDIAEGNGESPRVIGVMPAEHVALSEDWEFWTPSSVDLEEDYPFSSEGCFCWQMIGRLAPGVDLASASAEVGVLAQRIREQSPEDIREEALASAIAVPLLDDLVGDADTSLLMLFGAVTLVLLIACLNVANLLLARGESRSRDLAIRSAMGAGRRRLVAQSFLESVALGLGGGALGVLLAFGLVDYFQVAVADVLPRTGAVAVDVPVLLFALGVSVFAGVFFGLAPAIGTLRTDPGTLLAGRPGMTGRRQRRVRSVLVSVEVGLAVVLAIGAGLMVRTLRSLNDVDPGFRTENVLTLRLNQPGQAYRSVEAVDAYYREVRERLGALPGVQSVATINSLPLTGAGWGWHYTVDGEPLPEGTAMPNARFRLISPGYFRSFDIPVLLGRDLTEADVAGPTEVGLVNLSFVARHFDSPAEALGQTVRLNTGHAFTIVGVVPDNRHRSLADDARAEMYRPRLFFPVRRRYVVVATETDPDALIPVVRRAVWDVDPNVPILDVASMAEVRRYSTRGSQFYFETLGLFATLAIVLGMIGVYGVLSFVVNQSRHGIGIRMALGADGRRVLRETVVQGLRPVLAGLVLGLAGGVLASRLLENLLFGVTTTDVGTFATVGVMVLATAMVSAYLPARKAAAVDPMKTLRAE
jgi:predicted permease